MGKEKRPKLCAVCRQAPVDHEFSVTCGDDCRQVIRRARRLVRLKTMPCVACGRTVRLRRGQHPHRAVFCSRECRERVRTLRATRECEQTATCEHCGAATKVFKSSGRVARWCSRACKAKAERMKKVQAKACEWCAQAFETARTAQRFCCKDCQQQAAAKRRVTDGGGCHSRRAKKYGVRFEVIDPVTIFQRDRWMCQLCLAPIDPSLSWPHPACATLDHKVPMSKGGDHVVENLQAAHAACNLQKRNKMELFHGQTGTSAQATCSPSA